MNKLDWKKIGWREGWERIFNVWWLSYFFCLNFGEWCIELYSDFVYMLYFGYVFVVLLVVGI